MNEENFIKKFNQGYYIAKYSPDIADMLDLANGNSEDLEALKLGKEQYLHEQLEDLTPDWLKEEHNKIPNQDNIKDKEKDIEPEV